MEKNFGGPVWHASIRTRGGQREEVARRLAVRALLGVGDEALGEWEESGRSAYHIRRRLSLREQIEAGLSMRDVRGTDEARRRVAELVRAFPALHDFAMTEARL